MARKSQNYPKAGEDNKAFMRRCMHKKLKEEGKPRAQAVAICLNMWRSGPIGKSQKKALEEVKQNMSDVVDIRMSAVNKMGEKDERRKQIQEYLIEEKKKVTPKIEDEELRERAKKYNPYAMDALGKARKRKRQIEEALKALSSSKKK